MAIIVVFQEVYVYWLSVHFLTLSLQVSKLSLVDLAGSERANATGAEGFRLKVDKAPPCVIAYAAKNEQYGLSPCW